MSRIELQALDTLFDAAGDGARPVALRGAQLLHRADLRARAAAWSAALRDRPGSDWALHDSDGFELLAALFGAWLAGKRVWLPADELPASVAALQPRVSGFLGDFAGVAGVQPACEAADPRPARVPARATLMVYTSGTTGEPIAIPKTLAQLQAEIAALHATWGERVGTVPVVASVPHRHLYGLLFKLLWAVARGAPFHCASLGYPEQVQEQLAREPCVWIASPALLKRLPSDLDWRAVHGKLRAVFSSGGPLEPQAASAVRALLGQSAIEVYGSSETGGIAARAQGDGETAWQPLPGVAIALDPGQQTLVVRSPWLPEPWPTADRAELLGDGRFQLRGRSDRIVKIEEKRVSLDAIERDLAVHAWVRTARALQLGDGRVGAVIVTTPAGAAALVQRGARGCGDALRGALAGSIEPVALPRRFRFVDELPQDELGKHTQAACARLFEPRAPAPTLPELLAEQRAPGHCELRLRVLPSLAWFDGHFPGVPVLPGVVQVHWAIAFGRERFALGARFRGLEQLKFQQLVRPGTELRLELRHDPARGRLVFAYDSAAGAHSSGRVLFAD